MPYLPASVKTSTASLAHLQNIVYYERVAVENLKANLVFVNATERKPLPRSNGKVLRSYLYDTFAANTTPGTEGDIGTGLAGTTTTRDATIQQYFDFVSFSDLVVETAISPVVEEHVKEMTYRAALTLDLLTSTEADVAAGVSGTSIDLTDNEFFDASIVRNAVMSLRAVDARPKEDGFFFGIVHPNIAYDLINDNTAGGVIDILKHVESGVSQLQRGIQGFRVLELAGVRFVETTKVPTTANFPSTGKTGYHSYIIGKDAIFSVSLEGTQVPGDRNFQLRVRNYTDVERADPPGVIGATVAYNFKYAAIRRPGTIMTLRRVRSESSIA